MSMGQRSWRPDGPSCDQDIDVSLRAHRALDESFQLLSGEMKLPPHQAQELVPVFPGAVADARTHSRFSAPDEQLQDSVMRLLQLETLARQGGFDDSGGIGAHRTGRTDFTSFR